MQHDLNHSSFIEAAAKIKFLGIDFDGVMTDNTVFVFEDGREAVRCSRLEGFGLKRLVESGVEPMIVSTEKNPVVSMRAKKLNIACLQDVSNKVEAMEKLLAERSIDWAHAGFIGNDINDLAVLKKVGLPVVVSDAHSSLDDIKAFRTARCGGAGAVRELCDAIASVQEDKA